MLSWIERRRAPSRDLILAGLFLAGLIVFGTFGYVWIEGWSVLDGLYMTFLTLSTIGFNEVGSLSTTGRIFTMVIGFVGIGSVAIIATRSAQVLINSQRIKTRHMSQLIKKLDDHYIICGYGRIGSRIAADFAATDIPFVIIENDPSKIADLDQSHFLFVEGDAEEESSLLKAGLTHAKGLILTLPEDSMNVFVSLLARELNKDVYILARAGKSKNRRRLLRAGANKVISPYEIGAYRMSQVVLRPNVVRFMEDIFLDDDLDLTMEEVPVELGSPVAGKTLSESNLRQHFDIIVVGMIRKETHETEFNPGANEIIRPGDVLIVLGNPAMIQKLRLEGCQ